MSADACVIFHLAFCSGMKDHPFGCSLMGQQMSNLFTNDSFGVFLPTGMK